MASEQAVQLFRMCSQKNSQDHSVKQNLYQFKGHLIQIYEQLLDFSSLTVRGSSSALSQLMCLSLLNECRFICALFQGVEKSTGFIDHS